MDVALYQINIIIIIILFIKSRLHVLFGVSYLLKYSCSRTQLPEDMGVIRVQ